MKFIKMAMPIVLSAILLGLCTSPLALGQASIVRNRLQSLAMGKLDEVKRDLPDLLAEFPDDPGVQFLHASVLEDMSKSLPMYQRIVKEQPDCEWSDDAQWRIVHYYAMKRDTAKAREEMQNFRTAYPKSELLLTAYDLLRATVGGAGRPSKQTIKQENRTEQKTEEKKIIKKDSISKNSNSTKIDSSLITRGNITPPKTNRAETLFTLQVGVFKTKAAAEQEFDDYKAKRMKVNLTDRKMPDGSLRYVVTIGEYSSRKNAEAGVALVKDVCNCTPLIIQKLDQ
ncbi:MAG: SPOR domain-containing protein [Ignavibacteriae bacterium]|nr:SPOR domain-containing protein [Ignavibacteriota bacterium]